VIDGRSRLGAASVIRLHVTAGTVDGGGRDTIVYVTAARGTEKPRASGQIGGEFPIEHGPAHFVPRADPDGFGAAVIPGRTAGFGSSTWPEVRSIWIAS